MSEPAAPLALDPAASLRLLRSASIGRLVYTQNALPAIQPVTFLVGDGAVVCRNPPGMPPAAVAGIVVAFEADEIDATSHRGWSVTVLGHATAVTDPAGVAALSALPLLPSAVDRHFVVRITIEQITGCRLDLATAPSSGADTRTDTNPRR